MSSAACNCGGNHSGIVGFDGPGNGHAVTCPVRTAATTDPHDLAVEYIDHSISCQVALGYDQPTAERRLAAIKQAEREFWKLRELTPSPGGGAAPVAPSEGRQPRSADSGVSPSGSSAATFRVGDAVIVSYMGVERMGVILSITNAKGSSRRFYALDLPGALGHPSYDEWEMRHAA